MRADIHEDAKLSSTKKTEEFQELLDEEFERINSLQSGVDGSDSAAAGDDIATGDSAAVGDELTVSDDSAAVGDEFTVSDDSAENDIAPDESAPAVHVTGRNAKAMAEERIQEYLRKADIAMQKALEDQKAEPADFDPYEGMGGDKFVESDEQDTNVRAFGFKHGADDFKWEYERDDYDPSLSASAPSEAFAEAEEFVPPPEEEPDGAGMFETGFASPFAEEGFAASAAPESAALPIVESAVAAPAAVAEVDEPDSGLFESDFSDIFEDASAFAQIPVAQTPEAGALPLRAAEQETRDGYIPEQETGPGYIPEQDTPVVMTPEQDSLIAPLFDASPEMSSIFAAIPDTAQEPVPPSVPIPAFESATAPEPALGSAFIPTFPPAPEAAQAASSAAVPAFGQEIATAPAFGAAQTPEPAIESTPIPTFPPAPEPTVELAPIPAFPPAPEPAVEPARVPAFPPAPEPVSEPAPSSVFIPDPAREAGQGSTPEQDLTSAFIPEPAPQSSKFAFGVDHYQAQAPEVTHTPSEEPVFPFDKKLVTESQSAPIAARAHAPDIVNKPVVFPFDEGSEQADSIFKVPAEKTPEAHKPDIRFPGEEIKTGTADGKTTISSGAIPAFAPATATTATAAIDTQAPAIATGEAAGEAKEKKKVSKPVVILIDVLIILALITGICFAIVSFIPDSGAGELISKVVRQITGSETADGADRESPDSADATGDKPTMPISDGDALISSQYYNNGLNNIKQIIYDPDPSWKEGVKYELEGAAAAKPIDNDFWMNGPSGSPVLFDQAAVGTVIRFNSKLMDYINKADTAIIRDEIAPGSAAEAKLAAYSTSVTQLSVDILGIGNIRKNGDDLYVWTKETVTETKGGTPVQGMYYRLYMLTPDAAEYKYKVSNYINIEN
jgi:hypothetical protein